MISIFKSHSLDQLGMQLVQDLGKMDEKDPFLSTGIVVPNLETSRWLKLLLAEHHGFSGNLDFMLPAEWQWRQTRMLYPDLPGLLPSDPMPMTWAIFSVLRDKEQISILPELQSYISRQSGTSDERASWQLARQISAVFDQYLVYRPGLINMWEKKGSGKEVEKWQSDLWNLLDKQWKSQEDRYLTKNKAQLYHEIVKAISEGKFKSAEPVYVFNPGLIPVPLLKLLKETGRWSDLKMFMIEPSAGMHSTGFSPENELLDGFADEALDIHQAVADFIHPESAIQVRNRPAAETSNLHRVQQSIIENRAVPEFPVADHSIHIHSCHSELREVETLHSFLLDQFQKNQELSPDDVLVAMPDPDRYAPFIEAVFGTREPGLPKIPFHISGTYSDGNVLRKAFEHLLNLPDSRFTFSDVMDFVRMPRILKSCNLSEASGDMLKQWFTDNHVEWGLSASHRGEEDQPREELQTWKEAFRRGWMGQLTGGEPGEMHNGSLLYREIRSGDQKQVWAAFSRLIKHLETTRNDCRKNRTCGEWMDLFENWINRFFPGNDDMDRESLKLISVFEKLRKESEISGSSEAVSFPVIRSVLLEALETSGSGSAMFTRGVVFSSMVPVRSLPFKVIALLGLNDDLFPRKPVHPDFDLMAQNPQRGERNRKNEDRNLFLESILAAGEIHYSSYIGKSQKDDEAIPPSPILSEWIDIAAKASHKKPGELVAAERLYGFSPAYFTGSSSSWSKLYLETAQKIGKGEGRGFSFSDALPDPEENVSVNVDKLVRFFGNPVKGFLTERLGIRLSGPEEESDEFILDGLETHMVFQQVFGWILNGMDEKQIHSLLMSSGALPSGWPGERKLHEIIQWVQRAFSEMEERGYRPESGEMEINIWLQDKNLEGFIKSYSKDFLLDINPSRLSGKVLFDGWIRHLCLSVQFPEKEDSIQLCNLRKGKARWHRFRKAENAPELLNDLVSAYMSGLRKPLMFFPKTAYAYTEKLPDEAGAYNAAGNEWKKMNHQTQEEIGERTDHYISHLLGPEAEADFAKWNEIFRRFMQPMADHMEELK
ncbi:MAG: exodeoxyribonuclease V subunit gamma [Balneolaceae bacterium]